MPVSVYLEVWYMNLKSRNPSLKNVPPFKWITKANDGVEFQNSNPRFVILVHQVYHACSKVSLSHSTNCETNWSTMSAHTIEHIYIDYAYVSPI